MQQGMTSAGLEELVRDFDQSQREMVYRIGDLAREFGLT